MTGNDTKFINKLYLAFGLLLLLLISGTIGFILIEGYGFIDAFYMTVIVISTVGLATVPTISPEIKLFIAILIIISVGLTTYGLSIVARYIMEGDLRHYLKYRKVKKRIVNLNGHVIICGYGRNGQQASAHLQHYNTPHVIIEMDDKLVERIERQEDLLFVHGNATNDEVLKAAGIDTASSLISTLPDDSDNVYVVLTAKGMNEKLKIISRASHDRSFNKLKRAGADNVIMPDKIGGTHMAGLILKPDVIEFLDVLLGRSDSNVEEIDFSHTGSKFIGKSIGETRLNEVSGVNIIGMKLSDGTYRLNPGPETLITADTKIFILGMSTEVEKAFQHLS